MSVPLIFFYFQQNNHFIEWGPIVDKVSGLTVTDAVGVANLYDRHGVVVPGATALAMTQQVAGSGIVRAFIDGNTFNPPEDQNYKTVIDISSASLGAIGKWNIRSTVSEG